MALNWNNLLDADVVPVLDDNETRGGHGSPLLGDRSRQRIRPSNPRAGALLAVHALSEQHEALRRVLN